MMTYDVCSGTLNLNQSLTVTRYELHSYMRYELCNTANKLCNLGLSQF